MGEAVESETMLKKTLKSLCCSYGWSYGVFWRYDQRNSMLLTLEDAYYEEQMGLLIDRMILQVHMTGEGIVGEAAFSGKHRWVFSDDHHGERYSFSSSTGQGMYQDEAEIQYQFSSGLKTIAVISVESHGVLQFGSTKKVQENLQLLDQAKRLFCQVECIGSLNFTRSFLYSSGLPNICGDSLISRLLNNEYQFQMAVSQAQILSSKPNVQSQQALLEASTFVDNSNSNTPCISTWSSEGSSLTSFEGQLPSAMLYQGALDAYPARQDTFLSSGMTSIITSSQGKAPFDVERTNFYNPGKLIDNCSFSPSVCATEVGVSEESASLCTFQEELKPSVCAASEHKPSLFENIMQWLALSPDQSSNGEAPLLNDDLSRAVGITSVSAGMDGDKFRDIQSKHNANLVQNSFNPFAFDENKYINLPGAESDLGNNLGPDYSSNLASECLEDVTVPLSCSQTGVSKLPVSSSAELDAGSKGHRKGLFSELGLEQLLGDCLGNANTVPKCTSEDPYNASRRRRIDSSFCNQVELAGPGCVGKGMNSKQPAYLLDKLTNSGSQKETVPKSQVGLWIDDSYSMNAGSTVTSQTKAHENHKKATKKRARPGESTRPRPKDRQMIQDRLKELKDIIPNSGKLSIDALLDRTIKHLLFLQSVTKYADRLKQDDEPKLIRQEDGVVLRENFPSKGGGGGATWAFEVGCQTLVCPIIVEDLGPPGQMLIEMLCDEKGLFLEIADIIRGFSLTILKGVMEARENKLWARFTVEANENVTRMDIFMSLVNLLQQTGTSGKDLTDDPSSAIDGGMSMFNSFQQSLESLPISMADTVR